MKKLILLSSIVSSLLFLGCSESKDFRDNDVTPNDNIVSADMDTTGNTDISTSEPETISIPTETAEEEEPVVSPVITDEQQDTTKDGPQHVVIPQFILKAGTDYYFSDGNASELWKTGNITKAGTLKFAIRNELITLDASGDEIETIVLDHIPTKIKSTEAGNYYCVEITPDKAFAMGGQHKYYSDIYKDGANIGIHWSFHKYRCVDIVATGPNVFIKDEYGGYHVIDGATTNVAHVIDDRFYMRDIDMVNKEIGFNDNTEYFSMNYAPISRQWVLYDGVEYSETGYTWSEIEGLSGDGFEEEWTALSDFNAYPYPIIPEIPYGERPALLAVGVADDKLYWIECNSGWLFEYDPDADTIVQKWRMYDGDGMKISGIAKRKTLKPLIVDGKIYFSNNDAVFTLEIESGFVHVFYAGKGEVIKWD